MTIVCEGRREREGLGRCRVSGNAAPESTICLEGKIGIVSDVICVPLLLLLLPLLTVVMIIMIVIVDKNPIPFVVIEY